MLATYAELQQAIEDYLEQDDTTGKIPTFIRLAEVRIQREISVHGMYKSVDGSLDTGEVDLPPDFIEAIAWRLTSASPQFTASYIPPNRFFSTRATGSSPRIYTIVGDKAFWKPDPTGVDAGTYTYTLEYLAFLEALSDTNTSNWLLALAPDIYLYASLLEAMPYVIDDERLQVWAKMYERSITSLVSLDSRKRYRPGGVMRPRSGTSPEGRRL
jgi:hypothetical protein